MRVQVKVFLLLFILIFTDTVLSQFNQQKVSVQLYNILNAHPADENIRVIITLKDKINLEVLSHELDSENKTVEEKARIIIESLREKSNVSQINLLQYLSYLKFNNSIKDYSPFWITNCIWVEGEINIIKYLTYREDIEYIETDNPLIFEEGTEKYVQSSNFVGVETGLKVIFADKLWKLGYKGTGRIVMNIDAGVDGTHPALNYKWRGTEVPWYHAWLDADGSTFPTYCSNHGTHTMGIMCGLGTVTGDTIGVAIGAKWIAAKRSCSGNYTVFAIRAFQWALDPDSNSATSDQPDAINCSFTAADSTGNECTGAFKATLMTLEAAGIAVCWSAGNSGPSPSSITSPKNINTNLVNTFSVGAIDGNTLTYPIANFSSRGPSLCGGTGSLLIKPEVVAPGVNVRSSVLNGQYDYMDGTSMAAPHTAGAVALLKSFAPKLKGNQILMSLYLSATDLGTTGEDNTYGNGLINIYNAMIMLGPKILHTPLNDTVSTNGPYKVIANVSPSIITNSKSDTSNMKVFWSRNSTLFTDSINLQKDTGNIWYANIPGNGIQANYKYYIRVFDSLSVRGQSPADAPLSYYSFNSGVTGGKKLHKQLISNFQLYQNYPNPFNSSTIILFDIPDFNSYNNSKSENPKVSLKIYDILGKEVAIITDGYLSPGQYSMQWNAEYYSSGIYFYKIVIDYNYSRYTDIKNMLLIK